jgi:hypothetical protein
MNTTKLVATVVTAAFVSFIGLAYAQSTSDTSNSPGTSTTSEPDSKYVAPMMDASTMPQPTSTSTETSTTPVDGAPIDSSVPLAERAARTDRN